MAEKLRKRARLSAVDNEAREPTSGSAKVEADDRVPVYIKISKMARDILDRAAKAPRTRATVIEKLLESYNNEPDPNIRERILSGQSLNALEEHGELLELRSWAEHAFQNKRYVWAGQMYRLLADQPRCSAGLRNICHYRLSLCLIRLSYDVREEALKTEVADGQTYKLALDTLDEAINYTKKVRESIGNNLRFPRLVLYYNLASCHSLKAQYMVESELEPTSAERKRLNTAKKDPEAKAEVWKTIGQNWRRSGGPEVSKVDSEADKALEDLQEILPLPRHKTLTDADLEGLDLPSERVWLVGSTLEDEDFIFLREDELKRKEFERWSDIARRGGKPISGAVRALLA